MLIKEYKSGDATKLAIVVLLLMLAFTLGLMTGASNEKEKVYYIADTEKQEMNSESNIIKDEEIEENNNSIPVISNPNVNNSLDNEVSSGVR